jgi:hypothetical protein
MVMLGAIRALALKVVVDIAILAGLPLVDALGAAEANSRVQLLGDPGGTLADGRLLPVSNQGTSKNIAGNPQQGQQQQLYAWEA